MSLLADIAAAAAAGGQSNPAPASADGRFTASGAVSFMQQADALGQGDLARSLVAQNESGAISTDDARRTVMEAVHAARGSASGGGQSPRTPGVGILEVYGARAEARARTFAESIGGAAPPVGGVVPHTGTPAAEIDHAEIYASRRRATEASARAMHRDL